MRNFRQKQSSAILAGRRLPAFRLTLAAKDAALVRPAAEDHDADLPLLDMAAARLGQVRKGKSEELAAAIARKQK